MCPGLWEIEEKWESAHLQGFFYLVVAKQLIHTCELAQRQVLDS